MATDWEKARKLMFSPECPPGWPKEIRAISMDGLSFLGVHKETGELYWDGHKVVVQKPITLGGFERVLASLAAVSALGLLIVEVGRSAGWWGG